MEFDETNGFQEEDENLDDVKDTQLVNAMKNMDIGDIRCWCFGPGGPQQTSKFVLRAPNPGW